MIRMIRRYGRAFRLALRFTLRGEQPPLLQVRDQHPQLAAWWDQTSALVAAVESAAAAHGLDPAALRVHADKRQVSMATILATVKYHAESEYPYLLAQGEQYAIITLQATNLNDRYLVLKLAEAVDEPLKAPVEALNSHLATPPLNH